MFCRHCGTENIEESSFCRNCGNRLHVQENKIIENSFIAKQQNTFRQPRCPICGSNALQAIVESNTTSSGGGYKAGSGCLGYLLLGPLGLLCGACGSNQTTKTENKNYWICSGCGNKFRNEEEELKEIESEIARFNIGKALGAFIAILSTIMTLICLTFGGIEYSGGFFLFIVIGCGFYFAGKMKLQSLRERQNEVNNHIRKRE